MFTLDMMLKHHLQHNHYPPVSIEFVPTAKMAIVAVREGDFYREIELPSGVRMIARDVFGELHLGGFLELDFPETDWS